MSEPLHHRPPAPPPSHPRDAAAVMLMREGPDGPELFWVLRGAHLNFSAGFYAFPGGGVDPGDAQLPVLGASPPEAVLLAAAARELFEETGVLLAELPPGVSAGDLSRLRKALLARQTDFAGVLRSLGARLRAADFTPAGRWITPEFLPIRFDARFYLARHPAGQNAEVWDGELAAGGWIRPVEALSQWARGSALLHPPILNAMQVLSRHGLAEALPLLRQPPGVRDFISERIEFQQGILSLALETETLAPARHTNCLIVGNGELLIVDPGAEAPAEQARLAAFVGQLEQEGRRVRAVLLTHHHRDHVSGARAACRQFGVELWAHAATAQRTAGVDRLLEDGERIELAGDPPMHLEVLHTPGHAPGHLCLLEPVSRAVLAGDMVSGLSTIVIDPPEGDMVQYLASLRRLGSLEAATLYPAHGPAIVAGSRRLEAYLRHREEREQQITAALENGPRPLDEIVRRAYTDTAEALHPLAARSALATLIKLEREGRVVRQGDLYRL